MLPEFRRADGSVDPAKFAQAKRFAAHLPDEDRARAMARFAAIEAARDAPRATVQQNQAADGSITLDVFGAIGEGWLDEGFTAARVTRAIRETAGTITLRINSGGGDAFEGDAIRSLLAAAPNRIEAEVLALAASAATIPLMAADEIRIAPNGVIMIHNSSIATRGGVREHESAAQLLRAVDAGASQVYAARSGKKTAKQFANLMDAETWLTAAEAVELGLADKIVDGLAPQQSAPVDMSGAPEAVKALLQASLQGATSTPMKDLLKRLGLAEDATEADALAALEAALTAPPAAPAPVIAPEQSVPPAAIAAVATPELLAQLQAANATAAVDRFISEGRIAPSGREQAIAAASGPNLNACVAFWASCAPVMAKPIKVTAALTDTKPVLTALQKRMCKDANITEAEFLARKQAAADARIGK
jgi:ATP-dependent protease ClpP protease subunit